MKNKIKLLFILGLTLFGFGMLFNEGPSIVEADAATSISEDVVNNVKATPMTKEVESQSDSNVIDEVDFKINPEFDQDFLNGKNIQTYDVDSYLLTSHKFK